MPAKWKEQLVEELKNNAKEYPIIGIVDLSNMPLQQLQDIRSKLRGKVVIKGGRKRLFSIVIDQLSKENKDIDKLKETLECEQPGMLFAKDNPFLLYKTLAKSRAPAPAKAGQKAPKDIIVPAGPTSFAPGPIIAELGEVGVKAGIESGKIAIKKDSLVAKEGDVISEKLASILTRLNIKPMEIGLNLVSVYEKGFVFTKKILAIDEKEFISNLEQANMWAFNLAMNAGILTPETRELMIQKAFNDAKTLAISQNILTSETIDVILAKANSEATSLKNTSKL